MTNNGYQRKNYTNNGLPGQENINQALIMDGLFLIFIFISVDLPKINNGWPEEGVGGCHCSPISSPPFLPPLALPGIHL